MMISIDLFCFTLAYLLLGAALLFRCEFKIPHIMDRMIGESFIISVLCAALWPLALLVLLVLYAAEQRRKQRAEIL